VNSCRRDKLDGAVAGSGPIAGGRSAIGWEGFWFGIIRRLSPDRMGIRVLASLTATPE
jgi:hypothetical protein